MELISRSRLDRARAKGADIIKHGPVAVAARYRAGMIFVELSSGVEVRFPVRLAQGLENAGPKDLAEIRIEARGLGLHWPKLDVDLYVPSLLRGVLGTKKWMAEIGKLGGSVTSAAKAICDYGDPAKNARWHSAAALSAACAARNFLQTVWVGTNTPL